MNQYAVLKGQAVGEWYVIVQDRYTDDPWQIISTIIDRNTAQAAVRALNEEANR